MANILLTGGRAPVTLTLARLFAQANHTIFIAESAPYHLCRASRAVQHSYQTPSPKAAPTAYIAALSAIIQRERIDYLIPTCEEIFYVAQGRTRLATQCIVLTDTLDQLHLVHNKWLFVQTAQRLNLLVPQTILLTCPQDLLALGKLTETMVLKPVYSRFATATRLPPHSASALCEVIPTVAAPWIAQAYISGNTFCNYSIAQHGHLVAHATYPVTFKAGQGAAIVFETCEQPQVLAWVQRFVSQTHFHGQIAFDFIQRADGELFAIECNPRATSGVHLFEQDVRLVDALLGVSTALITPTPGQLPMLALAMLLYGLPSVRSGAALHQWFQTFRRGRDVVFQSADPLPWFAQFFSLWQFWRWSRKHRIGIVEATTLDIAWNGETGAENSE